jgi:hypothetical protein
MESGDVLELWSVFRAYILNDYKYIDIPISDRIISAWDICKYIIDMEAKL